VPEVARDAEVVFEDEEVRGAIIEGAAQDGKVAAGERPIARDAGVADDARGFSPIARRELAHGGGEALLAAGVW